MPRGFRRLGCTGSLIFCLLVAVGVTALLAPWAFHMGGRWTWNFTWRGVGQLRDSAGRPYGLYLSFYPDLHRGTGAHFGPATPQPRTSLRGQARVCTQQQVQILFDVRGDIYGAWLDSQDKLINLSLSERTNQKPKRHFSLHGSFQGPELTMDDHKSMFMYLQPDGKLTPTRSYTSPVPENHARVTLEWGSDADFDRLCRELPR